LRAKNAFFNADLDYYRRRGGLGLRHPYVKTVASAGKADLLPACEVEAGEKRIIRAASG
jgi:hypothetical protein